MINCYISPANIYVQLPNITSLDDLKSAILTQANATVSPSQLRLYQVKPVTATNQNLGPIVNTFFFNGEPLKSKLRPLRLMSSLSSLQQGNLHVVARIPPTPQVNAAQHIALLPIAVPVVPPLMAPPAVPHTAQPTAEEVHNFIVSATLPSYPTTIVASASTAAYTGPGKSVKHPGFLTRDPRLLQQMRGDLIANYFPQWNTLVNSKRFLDSQSKLDMHKREASTHYELADETTVCKVTDKCLDICIPLLESLGRNCKSKSEVREGTAGVTVDRLVKVDDRGIIAWEDKSPAVFQKHCTEAQIQLNEGELDMNQEKEENFRAILFKLSVFMVTRKIRWGVLHDGKTMYIFRLERKLSKLGVVISSLLSMDTTTGPTPISLICYMMLSGLDNVAVVDPNIADIMPASSMGGHSDFFDDDGDNDNNNDEEDGKDDNGGVLPEFGSFLHTTNVTVVDLPAFTKRVKINMSRISPLFYATSDPVHLLATKFIGEGGFGRVFKAVLCQPNGHGTGLVIKLAHPGREPELMVEAEAYSRLGELAGRVTPAFYGLFVGEFGQSSHSILVLSYGGKSLQSFNDLSKVARLSIMHKLHRIHEAGIQMNDVKPSNIVQNPTGYFLIDFSVASTNHKCPGIPKCHELMSVMIELQISVDDYDRTGMAW